VWLDPKQRIIHVGTMEAEDNQLRGCILADEMGCGKTIQLIALISSAAGDWPWLERDGTRKIRDDKGLP